MAKGKSTRTLIGSGPKCPRCGEISQIVQHGEGCHAKNWGHCKNAACVTTVFPLNSKKLHLDRVEDGDGPPCGKCGMTTARWRHSESWVPTPGKGYYLWWYQCRNDDCSSHQIMPAEAKVQATKGKP